jgi:hypothetical protein
MNKPIRDDGRLTFPDAVEDHWWRNVITFALTWLILLLAVGLGVLVANVVLG